MAACALFTVRGIRDRRLGDLAVAAAAAGLALLYLAIFSVRIGFNPWVGRLMIPMVALGAPLLALLATRPALRAVTLTLGVLWLLPTLLLNQSKVLLTPPGVPSALAADRIAQQTAIRADAAQALRWVRDNLPPTADIGFAGGEDDWDYPLFGSHRTRRVVRLGELGPRPLGTLRDHRILGALFVHTPLPPGLKGEPVAPGYVWVTVGADRHPPRGR